MRGKVISTNNPERKDYVGTFGEILLNDTPAFNKQMQIKIENEGNREGRYWTTSDIKKITVETQNTVYEIEVL